MYSANAATDSWVGVSGADWNATGSWSTAKPGAADTALFNSAVSTVANGVSNQSITGINFDTNAGTITIGSTSGSSLILGSGGSVQLLSTLVGSNNTLTINSPITLTPASSTTAGTYAFYSSNANSTNILDFGGAITPGTTTSTETLTLRGVNTGANTISGIIGNGAASSLLLSKADAGTWILSGANTFTGATTVSTGILNYQNGTAFGTNSAITVATGATAQVQGGITGGSMSMTISGTGAANATGALENVSGVNSYAGQLILGAASTISSDSGTLNLTNAGAIYGTATGDGITLAGAGNGSIAGSFNGGINGTAGAGALTVVSTGTWTLSGNETYTGATTVSAGTLNLTGSLSGATPITVSGGGSLLEGSGATIGSITSTLTMKVGAGAVTLSGTNGFKTPSISGGTLTFNGANGSDQTSTTYNLYGGSFVLDNTGATNNNNNRINDTSVFNLYGGSFIYKGSDQSSTNSTETIGNINPNGSVIGNSTLTVSYGGANNATLTATEWLRSTGNGTNLINGVALGAGAAGASSQGDFNVTTAPVTFYGTTNAVTTGINAGVYNTKIIPGFVGEATQTTGGLGSATGTANTFLSYDGVSFRPLNPTDEFKNNAIVAGDNTYVTSGATNTANTSINSLVINGGNVTINDGSTLTNTSGMLLFVTSNAINPSSSTGIYIGGVENEITVNPGVTGTINAVIGGGGNQLTKSGAGTLVLGAANTWTGGAWVTDGVLQLSAASAIGAGLITVGATGDLNPTSLTETTANGISGSASFSLNSGTASLSFANNYTGNTSFYYTSGVASVGNNNALGSGVININPGNNGGTIQASTSGITLPNNITLGATLDLAGAYNLGFSGITTLSPSSNSSAVQIIELGSGVPTFSGRINLAATSGTFQTLALTGTVNISGPIADYSGAPGTGMSSSLVVGPGGGGGTGISLITITGQNTYSGTTTFRNASVDVQGDSAAFGTSTLYLSDMTTTLNGVSIVIPGLESTTGPVTLANPVTFASGKESYFGGANAITFTNNAAYIGGINTFDIIGNNDTGGLIFSGTFFDTNQATGTGATTISGSGNTTISGVVANSSAANSTAIGGFTMSSSGTLALTNAANTFGGPLTINSGVVQVTSLATGGQPSSSGTSSNAATNLIINSGTLQYIGSANSTTDRSFQIGVGTGAAVATIDASGGGTLTITGSAAYATNNATRGLVLTGTNTGSNTFAGPIGTNGSGVVSVTKNGTGTWVLSAANAYTGPTIVSGGTLIVSGSLSGSTSTTVTNAMLEGTGKITNAVTIGNGLGAAGSAIFRAGTVGATGTFQTGPLSLNHSDAAFDFTIQTSGLLAYSQVQVTGTLALGAGVAQFNGTDLLSASLANGTVLVLATTTQGITGTFAGLPDGSTYDLGSNAYTINYGDAVGYTNDLTLTAGAIPEPGTWAMMIGGLGMLVAWQRGRRSRM